MNKDRLNRLKERLRRDHIFEVLDKEHINIRQDSEVIQINSVGNKTELVYFKVTDPEKEDRPTFHSRKISFKSARKLEALGIKRGIRRE